MALPAGTCDRGFVYNVTWTDSGGAFQWSALTCECACEQCECSDRFEETLCNRDGKPACYCGYRDDLALILGLSLGLGIPCLIGTAICCLIMSAAASRKREERQRIEATRARFAASHPSPSPTIKATVTQVIPPPAPVQTQFKPSAKLWDDPSQRRGMIVSQRAVAARNR